jgi:5'-deoxynucleotidase YfbR-like HD superfamily hydrolase
MKLLPGGLPALDRLAVLLHDAHEAYVGDWITPLKRAVKKLLKEKDCSYDPLEDIANRLQSVIHSAFLLPYPLTTELQDLINKVDLQACAIEKTAIMAVEPRTWGFDTTVPVEYKGLMLDVREEALQQRQTLDVAYEFTQLVLRLLRERHGVG